MNSVIGLVFGFILFASVLAAVAFLAYRRILRRAKGIERGLKMVPLLIHLPPPGDSEAGTNRDAREIMRERISQAEVLYDLVAGTAQQGFRSRFYGQRHLAFEIVASNGLIHFFVAVPIALVSTIEQAILTAYPGTRIEEVEDHNIFNPQGKLTGTVGGELTLKHSYVYPIATAEQMERDPMEALLNALSKLQLGDGAGVQIMLRPASSGWIKQAKKLVAKKRHQRGGTGLSFTAKDLAKAAVKAPDQQHADAQKYQPSKLEESTMQMVEDKIRHPGYEVLIRVLASSSSYDRSQMLMRTITNSFALYEAPGSNGFQFIEGRDMQGLVTAFIFRFFPPEVKSNVLNTVELSALFHLPDSQFTATSQVERQKSKQVDGPVQMSPNGLLFGYNFYRGVKKEVRLSNEDRRRHTYIIGQTGTGKSTLLENLAVQDMLSGGGFAFIDPHGDVAERLISKVPKERAEDVIYFNPADTESPLGLNLFEAKLPEQKDFLIQESLNMLYKLYDPGKTGIIGPRFEHWYRNAALTLMADPDGASFIELPKVFTDTEYLKHKFKYLSDPTVTDFWTKEMGQTSDYHKSEMLGWFVSKFGAFQTNEMMRNIIGQTKSAFDLREIMDQKKILIVNLSKGQTGELNSQLLGMLIVIKIQAAAMSRASVPEDQRPDFSLYVDEFQNFSTDSFASILSEARKYHLNLIVANQFIGQLTDEIREAVFGNIGTMVSYRVGPEDAEFLVKQFQPIFDQRDLVNLPNFNSVIKLLIGGLPSQPFSMTSLPPLGHVSPEMGLAVKQLSAAKFGLHKAEVEADIFARLQNKPRPQLAPPLAPVPVATPAPAEPQLMPQPRQAPPPIPVSQQTPAQPVAPQILPVAAIPIVAPTVALPAAAPEAITPLGPSQQIANIVQSTVPVAASAAPPAPASSSIMDVVGVIKSTPAVQTNVAIPAPAAQALTPVVIESVDQLAGEAQHEIQDALAAVKPSDIAEDTTNSDDEEPIDVPVLQPATLPPPHTAPIDAVIRNQPVETNPLPVVNQPAPVPTPVPINPISITPLVVQPPEVAIPAPAPQPIPVAIDIPVSITPAVPPPPTPTPNPVQTPAPAQVSTPSQSIQPTASANDVAAAKTMIATHKTKQINPINPVPVAPSYAAIAAPKASSMQPNTTLEPSTNPVVALPTPAPKPHAVPDPIDAKPTLRPGEIFVDDDGNVVQG